MSLLTIAWKSIRQRLLASSLTGLSVALGVALMVAVLIINGVFGRLFSQNSVGYDLVVGPKGSQWQLILNTIYRVDVPIAKMPWRFYQQIAERPDVGTAIPMAVSDTTEIGDFPIVATTKEFFRVPYAYDDRGEPRQFAIPAEGHAFLRGPWDAVIGAEVARRNGWGVGAKFRLRHAGTEAHIHEEEFTIQGVLAPTGTANDRTVFVDLRGFFLIGGHDEPIEEAIAREMEYFGETEEQIRQRYAAEIAQMELEAAAHASGGAGHHHHHHDPPDLIKGVSAILVLMRGNPARKEMHVLARGAQAMQMAAEFRNRLAAQAVPPLQVISQIRERLIGNINLALLVLTVLIIVVSGVGIFVSIYNSMSDRRREIAILRALGARRSSVFSIILLESLILCVGGGLLGLALGHGLVFVAGPIIEARSGYLIDPFAFESAELWLIPSLIAMATLVGFLPGLTAYRTDVAAALAE
jgi:putative ABC transport system permease protein